MLFQEEDPTGVVYQDNVILEVVLFLGGFIGFLVVFTIYKKYREHIEIEKLPKVIIADFTKFRNLYCGTFIDYIRDILIPVQNGKPKRLWGIQTDRYIIVPSHGKEDDIIVQDMSLSSIILVVCEIVGQSSHGEAVLREWAKEVFPPEMYEIPKVLLELPPNYILVNPIGKRTWTRSIFQDQIRGMRFVYAQLNKVTNKYDQMQEETLNSFGALMLQRLQSAIEIVLSSWQYVMDSWDITMKERVVPLASMKRLLHIPTSKMAYSSLGISMNHGGVSDAVKYINNINMAAKGLLDSFGMIPVNKGLHQAMISKVNTIQEQYNEKEVESEERGLLLRQMASQLEKLREKNSESSQDGVNV